jgi:uncharacterized protein (DUF952 family)
LLKAVMVCVTRRLVKSFCSLTQRQYDRLGGSLPIDRKLRSGHDAPMLIYKIFRRPEWDAFKAAGQTLGAPVDLADGFIHFSAAPQLAETAAKYFGTESDLVLVAFDSSRLGEALKWEVSRGGALFPHLYRALVLSEVVWDKSLPLGAAGHIFPEGVF